MLTHTSESTTAGSLASDSFADGCKAQIQSPAHTASTLSSLDASELMEHDTSGIFHQPRYASSSACEGAMQALMDSNTTASGTAAVASIPKPVNRGFFSSMKAKAASWFKSAFHLNRKHQSASTFEHKDSSDNGSKLIQSNHAAANHAVAVASTNGTATVAASTDGVTASTDGVTASTHGVIASTHGVTASTHGSSASTDGGAAGNCGVASEMYAVAAKYAADAKSSECGADKSVIGKVAADGVLLSESMTEAKEYINRVRSSAIWQACGGDELVELTNNSNNVALYRPEYGRGASVSQPPQGMGNIATPYGIVRTITGQQYVAPIVSLPIVYGKSGDVVTQRMIRPLSVNYTGRYRQFPVIPVNEIAGLVQGKIDVLKRLLASDASADTVALYLDPLLTAMIRICSVLPASEYYHDCNVCGLVDHNLKVAIFALTEFKRLDPQPLAAIPTTTLRRRGLDWTKSTKPSTAASDTNIDAANSTDDSGALSGSFDDAEELESPSASSDDESALSADASKLMSLKREVKSRTLIKRDMWLHTNEDTLYRSQAVADVALRMRIEIEENPLLPSVNAKKKNTAATEPKPIPADGLTIEQIMASGVGKTLEPSEDLTPPSSLMTVVDTLIAEGLEAEDNDIITDESIQSDVVVTGKSPYQDWTGEEDFEIGQKKATPTDAEAKAAEQKAKLAAFKKQLIASLDTDPNEEEGLQALCRRNLRIKRDLNLINNADINYFSSKRYLPALEDVMSYQDIDQQNHHDDQVDSVKSEAVCSPVSQAALETTKDACVSEQPVNIEEPAADTYAVKAAPKKTTKAKKTSSKKATQAACAASSDDSESQSLSKTVSNLATDNAPDVKAAEAAETQKATSTSTAAVSNANSSANNEVNDKAEVEAKSAKCSRSKTTTAQGTKCCRSKTNTAKSTAAKLKQKKATSTKATAKKSTSSKTVCLSKIASKKSSNAAATDSTATAAMVETDAVSYSQVQVSFEETAKTDSQADLATNNQASTKANASSKSVKSSRTRISKASSVIAVAVATDDKTNTVSQAANDDVKAKDCETKSKAAKKTTAKTKAKVQAKSKSKANAKAKTETETETETESKPNTDGKTDSANKAGTKRKSSTTKAASDKCSANAASVSKVVKLKADGANEDALIASAAVENTGDGAEALSDSHAADISHTCAEHLSDDGESIAASTDTLESLCDANADVVNSSEPQGTQAQQTQDATSDSDVDSDAKESHIESQITSVMKIKANAQDKMQAKRTRKPKPKGNKQNQLSAADKDECATVDDALPQESKANKPKTPFKRRYQRAKRTFANMSLAQLAQIAPVDSGTKPSSDESVEPSKVVAISSESL